MISNRIRSIFGISSGCIVIFMSGCGTGTQEGFCKGASNSGYVAATTDINGDPWKLEVSPETSTISCSEPGGTGTVSLVAVIQDSMKVPKAGLVISTAAPESEKYGLKLAEAMPNTDSCGTARFTFQWTCPPSPGLKAGGTVVIYSGALRGQATVTVEYYKPPTTALQGLH